MTQAQLLQIVAFAEDAGISKSKLAEAAGCITRSNFVAKINPNLNNNLNKEQAAGLLLYLQKMEIALGELLSNIE